MGALVKTIPLLTSIRDTALPRRGAYQEETGVMAQKHQIYVEAHARDARNYNSIEKLFLFPVRMTVFFLNGVKLNREGGDGDFRNNQ